MMASEQSWADFLRPTLGNGGVQPGDLEIRVRGGRAVSLHVDQPRRWCRLGRHAERLLQLVAARARLEVLDARLKLLALVVDVAH